MADRLPDSTLAGRLLAAEIERANRRGEEITAENLRKVADALDAPARVSAEPTEDEAGSSAAVVDGRAAQSAGSETVGERQGRQPASLSVVEAGADVAAVAAELARWSQVATRHGDLHARLALALALWEDALAEPTEDTLAVGQWRFERVRVGDDPRHEPLAVFNGEGLARPATDAEAALVAALLASRGVSAENKETNT